MGSGIMEVQIQSCPESRLRSLIFSPEHPFTYSNNDGGVYTGQWRRGPSGYKRHGQGKMEYSDGAAYEGQWRNDRPDGRGIKTYADGHVEDGEFQSGTFIPSEPPAAKLTLTASQDSLEALLASQESLSEDHGRQEESQEEDSSSGSSSSGSSSSESSTDGLGWADNAQGMTRCS